MSKVLATSQSHGRGTIRILAWYCTETLAWVHVIYWLSALYKRGLQFQIKVPGHTEEWDESEIVFQALNCIPSSA